MVVLIAACRSDRRKRSASCRGRGSGREGSQQNKSTNGSDDKEANGAESGFDSIGRLSLRSNQGICDTQYDAAVAQFYSTAGHQSNPSSVNEDLHNYASRMEMLSTNNSEQVQSSLKRNSTAHCKYLIIDPDVVRGAENYAVISTMEHQVGGGTNSQSADVNINDSGQIVLLDSSNSRLLQVDDNANDSQRFIQSQQQHQELPAGCWDSQQGEELHFPIIQLEPIGHSVSCRNNSSSNGTGNNTDSTLMNRSLTSSNSSSGHVEMNGNSISRIAYTAAIRPTSDINGMFCSSPIQFNPSGALNCSELNSQGELTVTDESSSFINEDGIPRGMSKDIDIDIDRLCTCQWTNGMGWDQWVHSLGCRQHGQQAQIRPQQVVKVSKANCQRCSDGMNPTQSAMLYSSTTSLSLSQSPMEQTNTGTLKRMTKEQNSNNNISNQSKRPERVRFVGCDN